MGPDGRRTGEVTPGALLKVPAAAVRPCRRSAEGWQQDHSGSRAAGGRTPTCGYVPTSAGAQAPAGQAVRRREAGGTRNHHCRTVRREREANLNLSAAGARRSLPTIHERWALRWQNARRRDRIVPQRLRLAAAAALALWMQPGAGAKLRQPSCRSNSSSRHITTSTRSRLAAPRSLVEDRRLDDAVVSSVEPFGNDQADPVAHLLHDLPPVPGPPTSGRPVCCRKSALFCLLTVEATAFAGVRNCRPRSVGRPVLDKAEPGLVPVVLLIGRHSVLDRLDRVDA